jgi:hypothetical protein
MPVGDKIGEAQFFLGKLKESNPLSDEFQFFLSAFLAAARSIPDYLLYDLAEKYKLGVPSDERITPSLFEELAREADEQRALAFIGWYNSSVEILRQNRYFLILKEGNDIAVHRMMPPILHRRIIADSEGSPRLHEVSQGERKDIAEGSPSGPEMAQQRVPPEEMEFVEFPNESAIDVCEKFLKLVKDLAEEAHSHFGQEEALENTEGREAHSRM